MEYKKDKRTKNLTLRDIHVGDWVQVWSEITERYSPPLKIIQICDDGTIYLVTSDEERPTPWEEDIKDVDALPIDGDILVGFGFEKLCDNYCYSKEDTFVMAHDNQLDVMDFFYNDKYGESASLGDIAYIHELQQALSEERNFIGNFNIEWKGIEKKMITLCNNQECSRRHDCLRYLKYKEYELEARQGKHFVYMISICDAAKCSIYLDRS